MNENKNLNKKGLGIATAYNFEDEPSSMIHEQLARLKFAESHIPMKSKRILDYGCGTGYNSYYIAKRDSPQQVIGTDVLTECIEYCKLNYSEKNVSFLVQDCLVHNKRLGHFDIVICCEVIEHLSDQRLLMDIIARYLKLGGHAFFSTPNRALFSFSKEKSFINRTHVKELFFEEFKDLICSTFSDFTIYSQVHTPYWHSAYINNISVKNCLYALQYERFENSAIGRILAKIGRFLYVKIFLNKSCNYPDVRERKFTDFEFVEGFDSRAIWFVAVCKKV